MVGIGDVLYQQTVSLSHGNSRILKRMCLHVPTIYKAYVRGYSPKLWPTIWYGTSILASWIPIDLNLACGSWVSEYVVAKLACGNQPRQWTILHFPPFGGFHKWRYPNSWMVDFMKNPNLKWMITRGTPIYGNPHWSRMFHCQLQLPEGLRKIGRKSYELGARKKVRSEVSARCCPPSVELAYEPHWL